MSEPTELEKQLHQAMAIVIDHLSFPFEVTKGGMILIRLSPEESDELKAAFELFTLIHGQELKLGVYQSAQQPRQVESHHIE